MKAFDMLYKYFDLLSVNDMKRLQEEKLKMDIEKTKAEVAHIKKNMRTMACFLDAIDLKTSVVWVEAPEKEARSF